MDFFHNGTGHGSVANLLLKHNFDPGAMRPWVGPDGRSYVTVNRGGQNVNLVRNANNDASLRVREWQLLDQAVRQVSRSRLKFVSDLNAAGLTYTLPNGLGHTVIQYQTENDISGATVSMDGLRKGERDRVGYDLRSQPLPLIHKDFSFSARELAVSRNGGTPLDVSVATKAARKVSEEVERMALGLSSSFYYGGGYVYGVTNFPDRISATITSPTASGWTPDTLLEEFLSMRTVLQQAYQYGPWMVYTGLAWDKYMDNNFSAAYSENTLRKRLLQVEGVQGIRTLDFLTGYQILWIQMDADTIQMINGLPMTTLQWEEDGGMELKFKIMTMQVPRFKSDNNNRSGILHANVA
jgi:hypothetical protein